MLSSRSPSALLVAVLAVASFATANADCWAQSECMTVDQGTCQQNGDREVCVHWDHTKPGCQKSSSPFDSVCVAGDRALPWYSGPTHKRCTTVKSGSNQAVFAVRGKDQCGGGARLSDYSDRGNFYDARCTIAADSPCRRVRVGATTDFCEWAVAVSTCEDLSVGGGGVDVFETKKPTKKPTQRPTKYPTKKPTSPSGAPTACTQRFGCTQAMLTNAYCDLRCNVPECNYDGGKCSGYMHIEYTGNKNIDPRLMPALLEATQRINEVIMPSAQMPDRDSNPNVCGWNTDIPTGLTVNQLIIVAGTTHIDGNGGALAYAGPCSKGVRADGSRFAIDGQIRFDEDDLIKMMNEGRLVGLIMHEVGHALGIGTMWTEYDLIRNPRWVNGVDTGRNPSYKGAFGNAGWHAVGGSGEVPIEDDGGRGTADGHWEEDVFKAELMTGWLSREPMPISKVTVGSFADMGIPVYMNKAEPFVPTPARRLRGAQRDLSRDAEAEDEWIPIGHDVIEPKEYKEVHMKDGTVQYQGVF